MFEDAVDVFFLFSDFLGGLFVDLEQNFLFFEEEVVQPLFFLQNLGLVLLEN